MKHFTLTFAQLNYTVGDVGGNAAKIRKAREQAAQEGADLVVFSELCITGYPPEDLAYRKAFQKHAQDAINDLAASTKDGGPALLVGSIYKEQEKLYNSAFLLADGEIVHKQHKHDLPNHGPFDEKRIFAEGDLPHVFTWKGIKLGVLICQDMWNPQAGEALKEAALIFVLNGSPYELGKHEKRLKWANAVIDHTNCPVVYVNQVGGQDELVFDGSSFMLTCDRKVRASLPAWQEAQKTIRWNHTDDGWKVEPSEPAPMLTENEHVYQAAVTGLRDYVLKNGFPGVILGLSGGIDSAMVATIAVDALGADKVHAVLMPSRYTSEESIYDAEECAKLLGIQTHTLNIESTFQALEETLMPAFEGKPSDLTEENMQSRIRGMMLMALSNKHGWMVIATGNKSEMSTGYTTLYGDLCGGYAVLKDIYKTRVFELARLRNTQSYVIPENIINKPPTAELRHDQKDEDSLPPYDQLDPILEELVENAHSVQEVIDLGHDEKLVKMAAKLLFVAEYKRRQSPPGVKITNMSFGRDRRYPITNKYKG